MLLRSPCVRSEPAARYLQRSEHDDEQAIKLPELYPKKICDFFSVHQFFAIEIISAWVVETVRR